MSHRAFSASFIALLAVGCASTDEVASPAAASALLAGTEPALVEPQRSTFYRPIAPFSGRLVLPQLSERRANGGVWIVLDNAPTEHRALLGKAIWLEHSDRAWMDLTRQDIRLTPVATKSAAKGAVHPQRLDGWTAVSALESLAGARGTDDVVVELTAPTVRLLEGTQTLAVAAMPLQVTGQKHALVRFEGRVQSEGDVVFRLRHYSSETRHFDGPVEDVVVDQLFRDPADPKIAYLQPGNIDGLQAHPLNAEGWSVFGFHDDGGRFHVQALQPYALFVVHAKPSDLRLGAKSVNRFIDSEQWDLQPWMKTTARQVALQPREDPPPATLHALGTRFLVLHAFGAADVTPRTAGIVTGHLSLGLATIVRHPFTDALVYDVVYKQVYAHNAKGIIAGSQRWQHYMGSLKLGWMYARPVSDVLVHLPVLTEDYALGPVTLSPWRVFERSLDEMMARYRTGSGTGASVVTPAASCVQDSNQAVLNATARLADRLDDADVQPWMIAHGDDPNVLRFQELVKVAEAYRSHMGEQHLLSSLAGTDSALPAAHRDPDQSSKLYHAYWGATHWRTSLPRRGHDEALRIFAGLGRPMVALQSFQIGGDMPDIKPVAPTSLLIK